MLSGHKIKLRNALKTLKLHNKELSETELPENEKRAINNYPDNINFLDIPNPFIDRLKFFNKTLKEINETGYHLVPSEVFIQYVCAQRIERCGVVSAIDELVTAEANIKASNECNEEHLKVYHYLTKKEVSISVNDLCSIEKCVSVTRVLKERANKVQVQTCFFHREREVKMSQ